MTMPMPEKSPAPVEVMNTEPLIVEVAETPAPKPTLVTKGEGTTLSPTTTEAQDAVSEGQRFINAMWEKTQSEVAKAVVFGGMIVNSTLIIAIIVFNREVSVTQLSLISICLQFINLTAGIVIGFYFSRTNHTARGGVGERPPEQPYTGR